MKKVLFASCGVALAGLAFGQATPLSLTGYNQDCIADSGTAMSSTSSTLDGYFDYYAQGFNSTFTGDGLPQGSWMAPDGVTFQLANFASSNVLLLGPGGSGSLTPTGSSGYSQLVFLMDGYNGDQNMSFTLNFAGGATQTGTFVAPDNYSGVTNVYNINTRVWRTSGDFDYSGAGPKLFDFSVNVLAANQGSALQSVSFTDTSNSGSAGIWAISGVTSQAVPEPSELIMIAFGAVGLIARRRK